MPPDNQALPRKISFVRLGLVVLVVVGLGVLIWAIFFRASQTNPGSTASSTSPQTNQTQSKPPQPASQPKSSSSSNSSQEKSSNTSTTTNPPATAGTSSNQPSTSTPSTPVASAGSSQLTNTGPGDVVALFAGVSVFGALLRYLYIRRNLVKN